MMVNSRIPPLYSPCQDNSNGGQIIQIWFLTEIESMRTNQLSVLTFSLRKRIIEFKVHSFHHIIE
jgi:hypothetical protein